MSPAWRTMILLAIAAVACGDSSAAREPDYERIARQVNPIFLALRPTAAVLDATRQGDLLAARAACEGIDPLMSRLARVRVDGDDPTDSCSSSLLPGHARRFARNRTVLGLWRPGVDEGCMEPHCLAASTRWCLMFWHYLFELADMMRKCAAAEGVEIVPLRPSQRASERAEPDRGGQP